MEKMNDIDACIYLGITKELLYSYVTKKTKGRKLKVIHENNISCYTKDILDEWNQFLNEPWSDDSKKNRNPPTYIKDYLKIEAGGHCALCKKGPPLEDAHIEPWSESFSHHHHNLIRLCLDCHTKYDDGYINKQEIIQIKSVLVEKIKNDISNNKKINFNRIQLPEKIFVGRDKEVLQIKEWLYSDYKSLLIHGIGGIGKTQLIINSLVESTRNIYWIDVEQCDNLFDLQNYFFGLFGVFDMIQLYDSINSNDLIVFDGYEKIILKDKDKAIDFLHSLISYATDGTKIIITSQIEIQDTRVISKEINLSEITLRGSLDILNELTNGNFKNDTFLYDIAKKTHGHPLTIRIFGSLIKFFRSPETVDKKIKDLGINIINDPTREKQNKSTSLEHCLILLFQQLSNTEKELIFYISCFPGGLREQLTEILFEDQKDGSFFQNNHQLDIAIAKLSLFHLIKFDIDPLDERRLHLRNSIRSFIIGQFSNNKLEQHIIRIRAFESLLMESYFIYKHLLFSDNIDYGVMKMQLEFSNYRYAIGSSVHSIHCDNCKKYSAITKYEDLIKGFASVLYKFLFTRGYFDFSILLNYESAKIEIGHTNLARRSS